MPTPITEQIVREGAPVRAPSPGLNRLLRVLADDEVGLDELNEALEQFPSIVARLLALANSAWASPRAPVTSCRAACTHLGLRLVRSIGISVVVSAPFNVVKCPAFDTVRYWSSCLLVADCAERLAVRGAPELAANSRIVHTAGLLHNIGVLWLADQHPAEVTSVFELVAAGEAQSTNGALRQIFGADVAEVSGKLLDVWGLPDILVTTVLHHRNPTYSGVGARSAAVLGGATEMVSSIRDGKDYLMAAAGPDLLGISDIERRGVLQLFERVHNLCMK